MNGVSIGILSVIGVLLACVIYYDLKYQRIPNMFIYPCIVLAFLLHWNSGGNLINALIGFSIGLFAPLLSIIFLKMNIGMGDVKLMALMGALVGFPIIFVAIGVGCILAAFVFLILSLIKRKRQVIPMAPAFIIVLIPCYLFSDKILNLVNGG